MNAAQSLNRVAQPSARPSRLRLAMNDADRVMTEMESAYRRPGDGAWKVEALAVLRRWEVDPLLDPASRARATELVWHYSRQTGTKSDALDIRRSRRNHVAHAVVFFVIAVIASILASVASWHVSPARLIFAIVALVLSAWRCSRGEGPLRDRPVACPSTRAQVPLKLLLCVLALSRHWPCAGLAGGG